MPDNLQDIAELAHQINWLWDAAQHVDKMWADGDPESATGAFFVIEATEDLDNFIDNENNNIPAGFIMPYGFYVVKIKGEPGEEIVSFNRYQDQENAEDEYVELVTDYIQEITQ